MSPTVVTARARLRQPRFTGDWHIGREIVEYIQRGEIRAEYGEEIIEDLSQQLQSHVGRGYSTTNL